VAYTASADDVGYFLRVTCSSYSHRNFSIHSVAARSEPEGAPIPGADSFTYTASADDIGCFLRVACSSDSHHPVLHSQRCCAGPVRGIHGQRRRRWLFPAREVLLLFTPSCFFIHSVAARSEPEGAPIPGADYFTYTASADDVGYFIRLTCSSYSHRHFFAFTALLRARSRRVFQSPEQILLHTPPAPTTLAVSYAWRAPPIHTILFTIHSVAARGLSVAYTASADDVGYFLRVTCSSYSHRPFFHSQRCCAPGAGGSSNPRSRFFYIHRQRR